MRSRQGYKGKALLTNEFARAATLEDEQGRGRNAGESGDDGELVQRRSPKAMMSQAQAQRAVPQHGEWRLKALVWF